MAQEDHDVGVDNGTASARLGEEVHPGVAGLATGGNDSLLLFSADLHDEEFLTSSLSRDATNAPPDLESLERLALVHQVARRLGHEEDANTHDGREDERGTEDVAPVTRNTDEHGGDSVAKDFSEGNVELVQGHQVTTETAFDSLGDVDGNGSTLETDTGTEDDTGGDNHAIVHSTRLKRTTNGVKNARDEDSPTAAEVFVARRDKESTGDS